MKLTVSPAPHIHSGDSVAKNMYGVLLALLPAFLLSIYYFGLGALMVVLTSVVACVAFEYLISAYLMKQPRSVMDGSALLTGVLLAFNLPPNIPLWIVVIGAFVAIVIGKMAFGGLGTNIFNPALVGRVFLLISFPVQMTTWQLPNDVNRFSSFDVATGATPLGLFKQGLAHPPVSDLFSGSVAGSLGEVSAVALLLGFAILLFFRIITWHVPMAIFVSAALFSYLFGMDPIFQLVSGGLILGAVFMATDYVTSPMSKKGMLIYGALIGFLTIVIRKFGAYPEGMSFAILLMNAFTPLINTYCKPKRFGERQKNG